MVFVTLLMCQLTTLIDILFTKSTAYLTPRTHLTRHHGLKQRNQDKAKNNRPKTKLNKNLLKTFVFDCTCVSDIE